MFYKSIRRGLIAVLMISIFSCSSTGVEDQNLVFKNPGPWINGEPFTLSDKMGEVVLIDFWTYTCVNCLRTLPYLKDWHRKYSEHGLTIVGVHSPEFDFEKVPENIALAVSDLGIEYPVFLDNEKETWRIFNNRYWPAKYLIDHEGILRYQHFGEGDYAQTEYSIRKHLIRAGFDISGIPEYEIDSDQQVDQYNYKKKQTRELYAGTDWNYMAYKNHVEFNREPPYIVNPEYFITSQNLRPNETVLFKDPGKYEENQFYIHGLWTKKNDSLSHARQTEGHTDYLVLKFSGSEVNAVIGEAEKLYRVTVTIDGVPLKESEAGIDVLFDERGDSYVEVDASRMFNIVKLLKVESRILRLSSTHAGFSLYSFTFGSDTHDK